ncbi:40S ribosomal protein S12 isoform X2 [Heterocephalus glaber]|uniref:40S ribosomal protein S12 n=1 Tax=Heterocephalus glaber TaxID=10181 RepID=A0AAX6R6R1_HETGA|nr:40S ribosomal protein S12 isoform X2 [Heterocephalus glaber]
MAEEGIAAGGVMDVNTALQEVLKTALIHDGLARGIREAAKALDKRQAHLCVLASNCDEPMYVKLVEALCAEHQINLIKVDDNKKLGEWVGLCKIDREGKPRKVVGCSCVVVKANNSGSKGPCLQKQGAAAESPVHLPEGSDAGEPRCSTKELALKNELSFSHRVQGSTHRWMEVDRRDPVFFGLSKNNKTEQNKAKQLLNARPFPRNTPDNFSNWNISL